MSTLTSIVKATAAASALAAGLMGAVPAALAKDKPVVVYAQPDNVLTERVAYGDLNLATRKGERTLELRVAGAVRRVCQYHSSVNLLADPGYRECASESWRGARRQIAEATQRAREIALNGQSSIAPVAITITAG